MASRFFFVFLLVILAIADVTLGAEADRSPPTDNKSPVENSAKGLIESLGPSQDYPDYEIPKELAPDGVEVVEDYVPISPTGVQENVNMLAQPDADKNAKTSPSNSASRSSSNVLAVVVVVGGASLFFF
ncbi:unnamed protein product [Microthlaspi erraticum]|uniref:Transmembrane protein n=1 Tax=Microthlaspi erraticum TaxID=1685480 RepID=A0A6D2KEM8_9BRAS|nr:unnamed protein product [Microthlaspi erraticum]